MTDKELLRYFATKGDPITTEELEGCKMSIIYKFTKLLPELADMNEEDALHYIVEKLH